jgi:Cupin domain
MRRSTLLELDDEIFRVEVEADGTANGGPLHRHLDQQERFVVHEGTLRVRLGHRGRTRLVGPGEEVVVPPGCPHTFRVQADHARFTAEFTPPLRVPDYFLELRELRRPSLRDLARLARDYPREHFYLAFVPPALQRLLLRPLA